ncbi:MAG: hypothetical protein KJ578_10970 [Bacteroidetes bacterium]|nr:hypothetical protein [Bacteroidota bacterium]MBU1578739.1 hypothetical protein [Bacteroidota bacterium]MBU2465880.1 hypothetical protein [Bacteroidota bacterium]MBU2558290.1 hypothetical protein [Bacteroidota bacterium]
MKKIRILSVAIVALIVLSSFTFLEKAPQKKVVVTVHNTELLSECDNIQVKINVNGDIMYQDYTGTDTYNFFIAGTGTGSICPGIEYDCEGVTTLPVGCFGGTWHWSNWSPIQLNVYLSDGTSND